MFIYQRLHEQRHYDLCQAHHDTAGCGEHLSSISFSAVCLATEVYCHFYF